MTEETNNMGTLPDVKHETSGAGCTINISIPTSVPLMPSTASPSNCESLYEQYSI